ncbi:MAG: alpha/beta fold hydrolase [Aerococcus sp.]|nr:alpha/beta fold hydrolase [Aerococcus sp.]
MKLPEPFLFEGSQRAVLLLHAYTGSTVDMRLMGRGLNHIGNYTTMGINFRGHATGKIEDVLTPTPADWMNDVQDAVATLHAQGHTKIAVFGLSLGGAVALRALLDEPAWFVGGGNFSTPILQDEISKTHVPEGYRDFARINLKQRGYSESEVEEKIHQLAAPLERSLSQIDALNAGIRRDIEHLAVPYFISASEEDELVDPDVVQSLYSTLQHYHIPVESHRYLHSKHAVTVGREHKQLEEDVVHFLDQLDWEE